MSLINMNKMEKKLTSPSEWYKFSKQLSLAKQTVEQLSKLYIIIHEKIKSLIKKSITNPQSNFSAESIQYIKLIGGILQKINQAEDDEYLIEVEKEMLKKYQKNLLNLLYQIQMMLKIQESKVNLNLDKLKSTKTQKRHEFDLKDEIQKSKARMIRTKSGKRVNQYTNTQQYKQKQIKQNEQIPFDEDEDMFPTTIKYQNNRKNEIPLIESKLQNRQQQFLLKLQQKQNLVKEIIINTITKNGFNVSFEKKYQQNNFQNYLKQRTQMTALIFNEQVYNQILQSHKNDVNFSQNGSNQQSLKQEKIKKLNEKLFPEFQIKTKFIKKPQVKSNIIQTIQDVKVTLLNEYNKQNINIIRNANEKTKAFSLIAGKLQNKNVRIQNNNNKGNNISIRRKSISNLNKKSMINTTRQNFKDEPTNHTIIRSMSNNNLTQRNTYDRIPFIRKKSLINQNAKPFYDTQYWNEKKRQKFQNQFIDKIQNAKINLQANN